jgi:hypothetical protein
LDGAAIHDETASYKTKGAMGWTGPVREPGAWARALPSMGMAGRTEHGRFTTLAAEVQLRLRILSIAIALTVGAFAGEAQTRTTPQDPQIPTFKVQIWGSILDDFSARMLRYSELRTELERELPPFPVAAYPKEIRRAQKALARRIRVARAGAHQGDMLTPPIGTEFKKILCLEMDADTWTSIMDDNPGEFSNHINGTYPDKRPLSSVPPNILARLPPLPDDVQYRFVGRHLILHDTRANLILDRLPDAIRSVNCDPADSR